VTERAATNARPARKYRIGLLAVLRQGRLSHPVG
jgi:hypothetical protein